MLYCSIFAASHPPNPSPKKPVRSNSITSSETPSGAIILTASKEGRITVFPFGCAFPLYRVVVSACLNVKPVPLNFSRKNSTASSSSNSQKFASYSSSLLSCLKLLYKGLLLVYSLLWSRLLSSYWPASIPSPPFNSASAVVNISLAVSPSPKTTFLVFFSSSVFIGNTRFSLSSFSCFSLSLLFLRLLDSRFLISSNSFLEYGGLALACCSMIASNSLSTPILASLSAARSNMSNFTSLILSLVICFIIFISSY